MNFFKTDVLLFFLCLWNPSEWAFPSGFHYPWEPAGRVWASSLFWGYILDRACQAALVIIAYGAWGAVIVTSEKFLTLWTASEIHRACRLQISGLFFKCLKKPAFSSRAPEKTIKQCLPGKGKLLGISNWTIFRRIKLGDILRESRIWRNWRQKWSRRIPCAPCIYLEVKHKWSPCPSSLGRTNVGLW